MTNGEWWTDSDTLSTLSGLSARAGQVEIRMMRGKRSPNCEKSQSQQPRALKDSEMVEAAQRDGGMSHLVLRVIFSAAPPCSQVAFPVQRRRYDTHRPIQKAAPCRD